MSLRGAELAMKGAVFVLCIVGSLALGRAQKQRVERVGYYFTAEELQNEDIKSTVDVASRAFLLPNMVMQDGLVFAISGYFKNYKAVTFQIWRPTDFWMKHYTLISQISIRPNDINKWTQIYIKDVPNAHCLSVRTGDRLGVVQETGNTIPYIFSYASKIPQSLIFVPGTRNGTTGSTTKRLPAVGETVAFEQLQLPYLFLVSVYIDTKSTVGSTMARCPPDLRIDTTVTTTTPTPSSHTTSIKQLVGPAGPPGSAGLRGPKGDRGEQGMPGYCSPTDCGEQPARLFGSTSKKTDREWWEDSHLMMGLIVWLVLLTLANVCLIAAVCQGFRFALKSRFGGSRGSINENVRETVREYNYRGGRSATRSPSTSSTTPFANMAFSNENAAAVFSNNLNAAKAV